MIRFNQSNAVQSMSQSHFATVPRADIQRSKFDRSHKRTQTMKFDYLTPFYYDEVLPGDTFHMSMFSLGRIVAPIKPIMDNVYADVFFIYVPNRLLSNKWESIMGQQPDPDTDVSSYALTPLRFSNFAIEAKSIHDYLGFNVRPNTFDKDVSPLYHLAYNFSWNELFRDENLQDPVYFDPSEASSYNPANFQLLRRGKRHDYFTSSLPWPQKGPDVLLPLGSTAPVISTGITPQIGIDGTPRNMIVNLGNPSLNISGSNPAAGQPVAWWQDKTGLITDLSDATAATINDIREAFQVQKLYEKDARGGTRYIESLLAHFGVSAPDFRLQRPEYLGGGSTKINISPIPQTSASTDDSALGNLAATGDFSHQGVGFVKSFVEHGVILGLMAIRADLTYQQGLHRSYNRFSRLDFAYPVLAHLGEQAVLNQEIYMQGDDVVSSGEKVDYLTFGFQERYAEYRYKPSEIAGEFRSDYAQSLDVWHLAQDFANLPVLNEEFIVSNTPIERAVSVTNQDPVQIDIGLKLICARPLPLNGVPGFVDHF